jgi:hypothetical protein
MDGLDKGDQKKTKTAFGGHRRLTEMMACKLSLTHFAPLCPDVFFPFFFDSFLQYIRLDGR